MFHESLWFNTKQTDDWGEGGREAAKRVALSDGCCQGGRSVYQWHSRDSIRWYREALSLNIDWAQPKERAKPHSKSRTQSITLKLTHTLTHSAGLYVYLKIFPATKYPLSLLFSFSLFPWRWYMKQQTRTQVGGRPSSPLRGPCNPSVFGYVC